MKQTEGPLPFHLGLLIPLTRVGEISFDTTRPTRRKLRRNRVAFVSFQRCLMDTTSLEKDFGEITRLWDKPKVLFVVADGTHESFSALKEALGLYSHERGDRILITAVTAEGHREQADRNLFMLEDYIHKLEGKIFEGNKKINMSTYTMTAHSWKIKDKYVHWADESRADYIFVPRKSAKSAGSAAKYFASHATCAVVVAPSAEQRQRNVESFGHSI